VASGETRCGIADELESKFAGYLPLSTITRYLRYVAPAPESAIEPDPQRCTQMFRQGSNGIEYWCSLCDCWSPSPCSHHPSTIRAASSAVEVAPQEEISEQDDADGPPCRSCGQPILTCECDEGFDDSSEPSVAPGEAQREPEDMSDEELDAELLANGITPKDVDQGIERIKTAIAATQREEASREQVDVFQRPCSACGRKMTQEINGVCYCNDHGPAEASRDTQLTTALGHSREEWHAHIDKLFEIAIPGEDIPYQAVLYAWIRPVTDADIEWAKAHTPKLAAPGPSLPTEPGTCCDRTRPSQGVCPRCDALPTEPAASSAIEVAPAHIVGENGHTYRVDVSRPSVAPGEAQREPQDAMKPCPFCGKRPSRGAQMHTDETGEQYGYYFVECIAHRDGVFVGVHIEDSLEKAIEVWNTRAALAGTPSGKEKD
jgi:hypothetical protein